jgi:multidrug efflux system membrane fusion protein
LSVTHILAITVVSVSLSACSRGGGIARGPSSAASRALRVRTAEAIAKDVAYRVSALGSLEADEMVQVNSEVEGAVAEVRFREGDRVTPETVLARIDPERHRLEAARSEATYRRAVADQRRAQADLDRREELARDQLVAVEELNRARQETERMGAEAAAAKAGLDIALQNRRRSEVRPPRAGVINTRSVDTGQFVRVGTILATLVDVSRLRLRFRVSEAESLRVKEGQAVGFRVAAVGEREFQARVYHVGDVADAATRQVEVLAWVKNPGPLKPGFFAEVTLATEVHKGALVVPDSAVQASERGFVTYVVESGQARMRTVTIGLRTGDGTVEILSGLKPGQVVVVEGSDRLADGMPVEAVGQAPETGRSARRP